MTQSMKLSEAIRLGAMLKPQAFEEDAPVGSCALKAAQEAAGIAVNDALFVEYDGLRNRFPVLGEMVVHPVDGYGLMLMQAIYDLNDGHRWTREQIADWVETIETAQTTPAESREEVSTQEHAVSTAESAAQNSSSSSQEVSQ